MVPGLSTRTVLLALVLELCAVALNTRHLVRKLMCIYSYVVISSLMEHAVGSFFNKFCMILKFSIYFSFTVVSVPQ